MKKTYLLALPPEKVLEAYVVKHKEYKVHKDSMIQYKGKRYSLPTKYIGNQVTVKETEEGTLNIYYNDDLIVTHRITSEKLNYKHEHAHEILKSDACKSMSDNEIEQFIENNLSRMDIYLGE